MTPDDEKCLNDIELYGCHVVHVLEEGELPPFSYSVGIWKKTGAAEAIVIGMKRPISQSVINEYNRRVRAAEVIRPGARVEGFVEGFACHVRAVHKSHYAYLGYCRWLYDGNGFDAVQIVYPTALGVLPWDPAATEWFRARQPLLDTPASDTEP